MEQDFTSKNKVYMALVETIESGRAGLEKKSKDLKFKILQLDRQNHLTMHALEMADIAQDRVVGEMKAYVGDSNNVKERGFKTYREFYQRKCLEQEHQVKFLEEASNKATERYIPNCRQKFMFTGVAKLLELKLRIAQGVAVSENTDSLQLDRLVL